MRCPGKCLVRHLCLFSSSSPFGQTRIFLVTVASEQICQRFEGCDASSCKRYRVRRQSAIIVAASIAPWHAGRLKPVSGRSPSFAALTNDTANAQFLVSLRAPLLPARLFSSLFPIH